MPTVTIGIGDVPMWSLPAGSVTNDFWRIRSAEEASLSKSKLLLTGLLVFAGYYLGAKVGFALTFTPHPVAVLWPPNSILTAAMLLTPPQVWWKLLFAAFAAHCLVQLESEVPPIMVVCWFISNSCEALIGASLVRFLNKGPLQFNNLRSTSIFCMAVGFIAPFVSSFLDAAFVRLNEWGDGTYWELWRLRLTSNILAGLMIVPLIVTWATVDVVAWGSNRARCLEAAVLLFGLFVVSFIVFYHVGAGTDLAFLMLPVPLLLWAALRFGSWGAATATAIVSFMAIWSAAHGHGPFSRGSSEENALAIQIFLITMCLTLLFNAALAEERKKSNAELRESEERFREMVESQTDLVVRFLSNTTLTYVNEAYCKFFGHSRRQLIGKKFIDFVPSHARDRILEHLTSLGKNRPTVTYEHPILLTNGLTVCVQWIVSAILNPKGDVTEIQGIGRDITDRVNVENALRKREARISLATESANLALWAYQPVTDTAWMSDKGRHIYGFERNEPLSRSSLLSRVHPEDVDFVESAFRRENVQENFEIEHRLIKLNGDASWVITRGRYLLNDQREILELIGVTIDVTAQKQATAQLQANREEIAHLSRVALMGEIAVSLAHELTQPLTAIMSNADVGKHLLRGSHPNLCEFRQLLADIKADVRRAGDVVHGIRRMVKKGKTVRTEIDLNDLVRSVLRILNPEALLNSCELKAALDPNLSKIDGDSVELQQVLVNLIINSIEAMRHTPSDQRKVVVSTRCKTGQEIEISVRDWGSGLTEQMRARLFEQFFTTKEEGLGMGLAITRSIIESHSGTIGAENIETGGARFYFTLPVKQVSRNSDLDRTLHAAHASN